MRWVSYKSAVDGALHAGLLSHNVISGFHDPRSLEELIVGEFDLAEAASEIGKNPFEQIPFDTADIRAPITAPPTFRDFMCFEQHLVNTSRGKPVPPVFHQQPLFYFSNPNNIKHPFEDVEISPGCAWFDYELEIAAVVGRSLRNVSPEEAEAAIIGYTLLSDWSARDLQIVEMTGALGPVKGKDGATSLGSALATPDELEARRAKAGYDLELAASVNGEQYSRGNWSDIRWSFGQMISYASRGATLRPGDLIGSGTVGTGCIAETLFRDAKPWLEPGDLVEFDGGPLGTIRVTIVSGVEPVSFETAISKSIPVDGGASDV